MQTAFDPGHVTVPQVLPVRIAIFDHHSDPDGVEATVRRFIDWRKAAGPSPRTSPTFSIWYSERRSHDPRTTEWTSSSALMRTMRSKPSENR